MKCNADENKMADFGKLVHITNRCLLIFFVQSAKDLYGPTFTVYNIHGLVHLHEDIKFSAKSLNEILAFPFKNFINQKNGNKSEQPIAQVAKRFSETGLQRSVRIAGPKISVRERDSFFFF